MKKTFLMMCIALISSNAFAQVSAKSFLKQLEYTISLGYGTTVTDEPFDDAIFTLNAGVDVKKDFKTFANEKTSLYGLVGVNYTQRGGELGTSVSSLMSSGNTLRIGQINVPIHVGLKHRLKNNWRLYADFGPYVGFNSSAKLSEGFGSADYTAESNTLDFGVGGNVGICFKKFGIGIGADKGFMNIAKCTSNASTGSPVSKDLKAGGFYFKLQWTFNKQ